MSEFINTVDIIGDDKMCDQIIMRTVTEYKEERITKIGTFAFSNCNTLTVVDVPNVLNIEQRSFEGCFTLEALILRTNTVVTLANVDALNNSSVASGSGYIYVPAALVDSYKTATNWSTYAEQIRAIEDYPEICGGVEL
jgi:hypothetical protein